MNFQVSALKTQPFEQLFGLNDEQLKERGVVPCLADAKPGFPCRVTLRDAEPGERLLLVNFEHQPVDTPYRSSHAIFVLDGGKQAHPAVNAVPEILRSRMLSVRSFDSEGMMSDGIVCDGRKVDEVFARLLADSKVAYLHVHTAARGCYLARVDRG